MALILEKILSTGVSGDYWKIIKLDMDIYHGVYRIQLALFKDEKARRDGLNSLEIKTFYIRDDNFLGIQNSETINNPIIYCYNKIKEPEYIYETKINNEGKEEIVLDEKGEPVIKEQINLFYNAVDKIIDEPLEVDII